MVYSSETNMIGMYDGENNNANGGMIAHGVNSSSYYGGNHTGMGNASASGMML